MASPSKSRIAEALLERHGQVVWDELAPFTDRRALRSAQRLGLGNDARALPRLTDGEPELARLVRCDLAGDHDDVLAAAGGGS